MKGDVRYAYKLLLAHTGLIFCDLYRDILYFQNPWAGFYVCFSRKIPRSGPDEQKSPTTLACGLSTASQVQALLLLKPSLVDYMSSRT
jgi:hypothetical protein